jgi:PAS domain S-box-containing protein
MSDDDHSRQKADSAQLQATLNLIPAHAWYASPSGGLTFVNKRTADYLGLPEDHSLRSGIDVGAEWDVHIPLLHPDDHEETRRVWSICLRRGEAGEVSFRVRGAQGGYRWFLSHAEPLRAADGTVLLWVGVHLDIEELKRAEQALRESELKLRQITETVPSMLWATAPDGQPTQVNQRVLDYGGMRLEDFMNLGWKEFLHPEDFPETATAFFHAIQTGEPYQAVHRLRRIDGEYRWHHARGEPLRDKENRIIQWYGLSVDIDERKKAEDRSRRSEAYLEEAERLSHSGSWAVNRKGERAIVYWSAESYRIFGFDPLQGIPTRDRVWQQIHSDDRSRLREEAEAALRDRRDYMAAFRVVLPDGAIKHLESNARHLFSTGGELLEVIGTFVDVTERKRAEEALRESEAKFRDYAQIASDWFWEIGPDYKFTRLTENAFGSGAADRIGTACWDHALDLESEPEKWRLLRRTLDTHESFRDFVYCAADGRGARIYVKTSGKPVFHSGGEFRGYRGTGTDVTEIIRAQEALRESERSSRSAIDGIGGLVAIMAPNGELAALNRQGIEYFGRSLEEMKNWGTSDAVHPEDLPRIAEIFQRSVVTGAPFHYELRLRRFDGEYRWFDNRGVPTRETSGRILHWYILGTDIEDRKQAENELRSTQAKLARASQAATVAELSASIAHEINQPLAGVVASAEACRTWLSGETPNVPRARAAVERIIRDGGAAADIVQRVRALFKQTAPAMSLLQINEVIEEVRRLIQDELNRRGISSEFHLAETLPRVHADRIQIQQVLVNLIRNGSEALEDVDDQARRLVVRSRLAEAAIVVEVCDYGPGLTDPERAFEPFYSTKQNGMGVGLAISRSIIQAHGGELSAANNPPQGTVLSFTLPVRSEARDASRN